MTFDEFMAEAKAKNLTINDLMPGVQARLEEMEREGTIRKHEDGGHEWVKPKTTIPKWITYRFCVPSSGTLIRAVTFGGNSRQRRNRVRAMTRNLTKAISVVVEKKTYAKGQPAHTATVEWSRLYPKEG